MGIGPSYKSSYSTYDKPKAEIRIEGNPDPFDFRIDRHEQLDNYLILLVVYRGVKNYEGKKVMVYKDLTYKQVQTFKSLDPHFSESKAFASPIARFKPDITGWAMAKRFVNCLIN